MAAPAAMIEEYLAVPKKLRAAVAGLTREQITARPVQGKWSILEVVSHIADFEPVYVERMKRMIALENPLMLGADEKLFAAHLAYQERDLAEELEVIDTTRKAFSRVLRTLPPAVFRRTGVHSERGIKTLEELLVGVSAHIEHHLPFIEEKRRALKASG